MFCRPVSILYWLYLVNKAERMITMSNGDFIRSMKNEELIVMYIIMHDKFNPWDKEDLLIWLESEAEEW